MYVAVVKSALESDYELSLSCSCSSPSSSDQSLSTLWEEICCIQDLFTEMPQQWCYSRVCYSCI